jgi:hypothetical protein
MCKRRPLGRCGNNPVDTGTLNGSQSKDQLRETALEEERAFVAGMETCAHRDKLQHLIQRLHDLEATVSFQVSAGRIHVERLRCSRLETRLLMYLVAFSRTARALHTQYRRCGYTTLRDPRCLFIEGSACRCAATGTTCTRYADGGGELLLYSRQFRVRVDAVFFVV